MSVSTALTSAVVISIAGALGRKAIKRDIGYSARTADEGSFRPTFDSFHSTDRPFLLLPLLRGQPSPVGRWSREGGTSNFLRLPEKGLPEHLLQRARDGILN